MKKIVCLLIALILTFCASALADDPDEIPGTLDMPYAGLRFVPPELYRNTAGQLYTDAAIPLFDGVYYAYWLYCAMTEEELLALLEDPYSAGSSPLIRLFYVFSVGDGKSFDDMNALLDAPLPAEYAREIGKAGEYTFYLYMEEPNQDFADSIDPSYKDEYIALAGAVDDAIAAFTCYEPVDPYASLIGTKVEFTAADMDGNTVSSADLFAQNEITMLNIWTTWCGPCIGELAELQQIHTRLQEKGCGIIGFLDDTDLDAARQLIAENGITYPVILAPEDYNTYLPNDGFPTSYFINRDGEIIDLPVSGAYVEWYEPVIEALLQGQE